jgi:hypothetical protein
VDLVRELDSQPGFPVGLSVLTLQNSTHVIPKAAHANQGHSSGALGILVFHPPPDGRTLNEVWVGWERHDEMRLERNRGALGRTERQLFDSVLDVHDDVSGKLVSAIYGRGLCRCAYVWSI